MMHYSLISNRLFLFNHSISNLLLVEVAVLLNLQLSVLLLLLPINLLLLLLLIQDLKIIKHIIPLLIKWKNLLVCPVVNLRIYTLEILDKNSSPTIGNSSNKVGLTVVKYCMLLSMLLVEILSLF